MSCGSSSGGCGGSINTSKRWVTVNGCGGGSGGCGGSYYPGGSCGGGSYTGRC